MNNRWKYKYFIIHLLLVIFILWSIYNYIVEEFKPETQDPVLLELKDKIRVLYPSIDKLEFYDSNKSFTTNKQKVHICLKDENGDYYNRNMLTYVMIHELAHVLCDEIGHTEKFYKIFQELLDEAHQKGIYDPSIPIVKNYCGY